MNISGKQIRQGTIPTDRLNQDLQDEFLEFRKTDIINIDFGDTGNVTDRYLKRTNGTFSNLTPYIVSADGVIDFISSSTRDVEVYDLEIFINSSLNTTINIPGGSRYSEDLNISVTAGDEISVRLNGNQVRDIAVSLQLKI